MAIVCTIIWQVFLFYVCLTAAVWVVPTILVLPELIMKSLCKKDEK